MCVGSLAGLTYLLYTVLISPSKDETVRCFDPALSVLAMLVSQNVFHVVSTLQFIVFTLVLIRSLVDHKLAVFIACAPLKFLVSHLCIFGP